MKIQTPSASHLSIMVFAFLCCLGFQTAFAEGCKPSDKGTGESDNPYLIRTADELQNLKQCLGKAYEGNNYVLENDINLSGKSWQPIGTDRSNPFSGTLNGRNHKVSGLKIISPLYDKIGLFGYVSSYAELKNIRVEIDTVRGFDYVGGLVGENWGKITNSHVKGNVSGNQFVGLIAGYNNGKISSSYANGNVLGNLFVGSLAGYNDGTMSNCYATMGGVFGSNYVGGLAGYNNNGGTIQNSYFVGSVTPVTATCTLVDKEPVITCPPEMAASKATFKKTYLPDDSYIISVSAVVCGEITPSNLPTCGTITVEASSSSVESSSSSSVPAATPTCSIGGCYVNGSGVPPPTYSCGNGETANDANFRYTAAKCGTVSSTANSNWNSKPPSSHNVTTRDSACVYMYAITCGGKSLTQGTAGNKDGWLCEGTFDVKSAASSCPPSSSSSQPTYITLGLQPGKNTRELNFNWYSETGTDKSFVRLFKNGYDIYFTGTSGTASAGYLWHKATVTGLEPNTEYTYQVSNDSTKWSSEYKFKTPPTGPFKFAAVADVQPDCGSSADCPESIIGPWRTIATKIYDAGATLIVNAGDHVEYSNRENEYKAFFSPPEIQSIPTAPVMGNHDGVVGRTYNFNNHFNLPNPQTGNGNYKYGNSNYYFLYNRVLFIGLNTSPYPENAQSDDPSPASTYVADFKATIDSAKAAHSPLQYDFIVVTHHKSTNSITNCTNDNCSAAASTGHTLDKDVIAYVEAGLQTMMTEKGVDLVLTGHNHIYVRSKLMYNDSESTNGKGTLYLTLKPAGITRNYAGAFDIGYDTSGWTNYVNSYPFIKHFYRKSKDIDYYVPTSYEKHIRYGTTADSNGNNPGYLIIEVNNGKMTINGYDNNGLVDSFFLTPTLLPK